jgi:hypothetical protein
VIAVPYTASGSEAYYFAFRDVNQRELFVVPNFQTAAALRAGAPAFTTKALPKQSAPKK